MTHTIRYDSARDLWQADIFGGPVAEWLSVGWKDLYTMRLWLILWCPAALSVLEYMLNQKDAWTDTAD